MSSSMTIAKFRIDQGRKYILSNAQKHRNGKCVAPLVIVQPDEQDTPEMQQVADAAMELGEILDRDAVDFHNDDDDDEVDTDDPIEDAQPGCSAEAQTTAVQAPWLVVKFLHWI